MDKKETIKRLLEEGWIFQETGRGSESKSMLIPPQELYDNAPESFHWSDADQLQRLLGK